jgi:hypothetical protein
MRDAVNHIGEKMKTPKKFAEHAFSGSIDSRAIKADNVKRMTMSNVLDGRRFTNTWEGQVLKCEISQLSLSRLTEAKQHLWAAARPIETGTSLLAARTRLVTFFGSAQRFQNLTSTRHKIKTRRLEAAPTAP